jgi:LAGLIDADG endonuclease
MPWTNEELAYLAGFIDGEGSISIFSSSSKSKGKIYPRLRLILSAYNTNEAVLQWIKSRFGGTVIRVKRSRRQHKQCYAWNTGWQNASSVLQAAMPFLRVKKPQAELFIACANTSKKWGLPGVPKNVVAFRESLAAKISILNLKGNQDALEEQRCVTTYKESKHP